MKLYIIELISGEQLRSYKLIEIIQVNYKFRSYKLIEIIQVEIIQVK